MADLAAARAQYRNVLEEVDRLDSQLPEGDPSVLRRWTQLNNLLTSIERHAADIEQVQEVRRRTSRLGEGEDALTIESLRIGSPLELTLAAAGSTTALVYTAHLVAKALRDPAAIGAWFPRLLAGWHRGMADLEEARRQHDVQRAFEDAVLELRAPATSVEVTNAGEVPEELATPFSD
jgi:hypothetical protein